MSQISNFQSLNHFSSNFEMSNKEYFKMEWNARLMQFRRLMIHKVETPFGRKKPSGFLKWDVPRVCGLRIDNECLHHRAEQSEQKKWSFEVGSDSSSPFSFLIDLSRTIRISPWDYILKLTSIKTTAFILFYSLNICQSSWYSRLRSAYFRLFGNNYPSSWYYVS